MGKTILEMIRYQAIQFCKHTGLHGYGYIVLPKRALLERVFWINIVLIALLSAIALMIIGWVNIDANPTLLVIDSTHHPVWNYPFPAITICSYNKLSKSRVRQLANKIKNKTGTYLLDEELQLFFQLIFSNRILSEADYQIIDNLISSIGLEAHEALSYLAPTCDEILIRCQWKGELKRCDTLFEKVATSEGFCCAFNYYALRNHTFGGSRVRSIPSKAQRVSACGFTSALEVLMNTDVEDYFATQIPSIGHRILIHNSYYLPDWTAQSVLTDPQTINLIAVNPTITVARPNIRQMAVEKRKCLFADERKLHNFVNYSYHNCLAECRMNVTREICKCIEFYYFNPNGTYPDTKICSYVDLPCLTHNRDLIITSTPGVHLTNNEIYKNNYEENPCNCLEDCEYVEYLSESSNGILTREFSQEQISLFSGIKIKNQTLIRVFYNDLVATQNRRGAFYSWHTLLAFYGGLLGLFVGFSFVSGIEVIYFLTIRLFSDLISKKKTVHPPPVKSVVTDKMKEDPFYGKIKFIHMPMQIEYTP